MKSVRKLAQEVARRIEWGNEGYCPECGREKNAYVHKPDCALGQLAEIFLRDEIEEGV